MSLLYNRLLLRPVLAFLVCWLPPVLTSAPSGIKTISCRSCHSGEESRTSCPPSPATPNRFGRTAPSRKADQQDSSTLTPKVLSLANILKY
eukprot:1157288-Pelagomonas_calceolata.AAC.2